MIYVMLLILALLLLVGAFVLNAYVAKKQGKDEQQIKKETKTLLKLTGIIFGIFLLAIMIGVGGILLSEYNKKNTNFDNGLDKMIHGETLTEDEEEAVNDFYEWNDEQYRNK